MYFMRTGLLGIQYLLARPTPFCATGRTHQSQVMLSECIAVLFTVKAYMACIRYSYASLKMIRPHVCLATRLYQKSASAVNCQNIYKLLHNWLRVRACIISNPCLACIANIFMYILKVVPDSQLLLRGSYIISLVPRPPRPAFVACSMKSGGKAWTDLSRDACRG